MSTSADDIRDRSQKKPRHHKNKWPQHTVETTDLDTYSSMPHIPLTDYMDRPSSSSYQSANWRNDTSNILLLLFLYVLQGVPLGLAGSIPMLLQTRQISYREQAMFSFVYWPFSLKLLWAPIVDALYLPSMGRRKSWMVPSQYLIGLFMIFLSYYVKDLLGDEGAPANVLFLTCIFFMLNFLAATQDIAVDGWALTMLSKQNVGWASTCNSIGQTAGYFLGNVLFLALESPDFCNKYLRFTPHNEGIITLAGFLFFWGIVFFVTTTLVFFLKPEKVEKDDLELGIIDTYKLLIQVIKLPAVLSFAIILLTSKIGFSAPDSLTGLKLIEAGVPKERLALFAIPLIPIQVILPLVISRVTNGPRPMDIYLKVFPIRLLMAIPYAGLVYMASRVALEVGVYPIYFYVGAIMIYALHQVTVYCMFVPMMAFNAKISDPAIGGSYMTLLNTLSNLGGNWPATVSLWIVDSLTFKGCTTGISSCANSAEVQMCTENGGSCFSIVDGYYVEIVICTLIGFAWFFWKKDAIRKLQTIKPDAWKISQ